MLKVGRRLKNPSREPITPTDVDGAAKDSDLAPNTQVIRANICKPVCTPHLLPLQERSLSNSGVLHLRFVHAHGPILHVEHDGNMSIACIFVWPFGHGFLEEAIKPEDLQKTKAAKQYHLQLPALSRSSLGPACRA